MAIVTRCPACDTVFRVAPAQLQVRGGMVRCGRCMTVFDGFKSLTTAPEPPPLNSAAPANATAIVNAPEPAAPRNETETPKPSAESAFRLEPVSATELAAAAARTLPPRADFAEEPRDYGPAPEQLTIEDHLYLDEKEAARARSTRLWAAGVALMLVALLTQLVFVFRGAIAARFPAARPHLVGACAALGCVVNLPQQPRRIAIEASDLQATDPARPGLIQLTATVRNHAGYDVGFPALDLVLTNTRDHTLARRIFQPRDYLDPRRDLGAGIPANAEVTIHLELDTGDLNPAGFRLDLLAAQVH